MARRLKILVGLAVVASMLVKGRRGDQVRPGVLLAPLPRQDKPAGYSLRMEVNDLKNVWEDWAREDPLWAILSDPAKTNRRWDRKEFFATGKQEIRLVMSDIAKRGISLRRGRCLDFGCGVGRLTQGLADFFDTCDGVDISETMVQQARKWNEYPDRCTYHLNEKPDLSLFPDQSFDFIYTNIVLQHMEPNLSEQYVREFVRLLADGGLALFQVPSAYVTPEYPPLPESAHLASLTLAETLPALVAGVRAPLSVRVRNDSQSRWSPLPTVKVGNHWRSPDGSTVLQLDDGRGNLLIGLDPGQDTTIDFVVEAPKAPGAYVLEIDMVEEGVCWFADRGSPTLRLTVHVSGLAKRIRGQLTSLQARRSAKHAPPQAFGMYALPREQVVKAVEGSGGRFLAVEDYNPSGDGWESYRYYVTTSGVASPTP